MHKAKALIVTCIDFRFQLQIQEWLKENGYLGHADEVVLAGGSRDLVKPIEQFHKDSIERQIELSVKLHDPDEILIIDHQECGGYAQDGTIPNGITEDEDKNMHTEYSKQAKEMLVSKYPGKVVKTYYINLKNDIIEI